MAYLPYRCECALFLAFLYAASRLSRAQAVFFRPELPVGKVKKLRSIQIRESYWGILRGMIFDNLPRADCPFLIAERSGLAINE
jgi:hypothetical protein